MYPCNPYCNPYRPDNIFAFNVRFRILHQRAFFILETNYLQGTYLILESFAFSRKLHQFSWMRGSYSYHVNFKRVEVPNKQRTPGQRRLRRKWRGEKGGRRCFAQLWPVNLAQTWWRRHVRALRSSGAC